MAQGARTKHDLDLAVTALEQRDRARSKEIRAARRMAMEALAKVEYLAAQSGIPPLPTDVIAPVTPPPVVTSGTALERARAFFLRFLAGMRG